MKILPMKYPLINSYNVIANILSIAGDCKGFDDWVFNNFIQLEYHEFDKEFQHVNFCIPYDMMHLYYICPWIELQKINKTLINYKWNGNIHDFIKDSIEEGCYLFLLVDRFYIPESNAYQKYTQLHEILIYGYNEIEKKYYYADNIASGKYTYTECSYEQLGLGYSNIKEVEYDYESETPLEEQCFKKQVYLLKMRPFTKYICDRKLIKDSVKGYLLGRNDLKKDKFFYGENYRPGREYKFGITVHLSFRKYIESMIENNLNNIDKRMLHILWNHKFCMLKRLEYLNDSKLLDNAEIIINGFKEVEQTQLIIMNLMIKYSLSKNKSILEIVRSKITQNYESEKEVLSCFINNLR